VNGATRLAAAVLAALSLSAAADTGAERPPHVIVLGIDGMDPALLTRFLAEGRLRNFAALAREGGFMPLATSTPPQSPVAWSDFITGTDAGSHGIFDFVALDREKLEVVPSSTRIDPAARAPLEIGRWRIPLAAEQPRLLRDGVPFWQLLEQHGVRTTLVSMPANYPPVGSGTRELSGMGTPDLRGTPGLFSFYTDDPQLRGGSVPGGTIYPVRAVRQRVRAELEGPLNELVKGAPRARASFTLTVDPDPTHAVAELEIGGERALLNVGEWSGWLPVEFELLPWVASARGMVRFYLKSLTPHLALYASPVNIDPRAPAQTIAAPEGYAHELAEAAGPFYTEEMAEDTKALSAGVLTPREFLAQSSLVLEERKRLLRVELARFAAEPGPALLFFYLSSIDQRSHMLWREMEAPEAASSDEEKLANAVRDTYVEIDALLGSVREQLPTGALLIAMSDHGFAPFLRQAHLNAWLEQHGYLALADPAARERAEWLSGIDWTRTRAFAVGLNSLYLNVRGRERRGIVDPAERQKLAREIAAGLAAWKDPQTGQPVVSAAQLREEVYAGPHLEAAPDLIVGYNRGYRASWATTSGQVPAALLEDNREPWSGDHCMDARAVPGILVANRPLRERSAGLRDLTVTVLHAFGVQAPPQMKGRSIF
jgi:predicted AlkP superfamily phosphohydrolase/phosphomutase